MWYVNYVISNVWYRKSWHDHDMHMLYFEYSGNRPLGQLRTSDWRCWGSSRPEHPQQQSLPRQVESVARNPRSKTSVDILYEGAFLEWGSHPRVSPLVRVPYCLLLHTVRGSLGSCRDRMITLCARAIMDSFGLQYSRWFRPFVLPCYLILFESV